MKTPKLNVRLLRKIQKHITEEPRRFFMEDVRVKFETEKEWKHEARYFDDMAKTMPPCGTAACIAGWTNIFTGAKTEDQYFSHKRAVKKLGLIADSEVAGEWYDDSTLFYAANWPAPFEEDYSSARTPARRAKVACARIDHLIKTGE